MKQLSWKEFKEALELAGVKPDDKIAWIDWDGTYLPHVEQKEDKSWTIS